MPAKIRTIKATSISALETFNFNRSIEYQGESLGLIKLIEKKPGSIKAKVYQDLNNDNKMTTKDLIYKGTINDVDIPDDLTNFSGTVKLKKQMHNCDWEMQKYPGKAIICTEDYVPTSTDLKFKSNITGIKYSFPSYGDDGLYRETSIYFLKILQPACQTRTLSNNVNHTSSDVNDEKD